MDITFDKIKEECAVVGFNHQPDIGFYLKLSLHTLQHRGQEGCGLACFDGQNVRFLKKEGSAISNIKDIDIANFRELSMGIGHARYSTSGSKNKYNLQPMVVNDEDPIVFAHNGNITNIDFLKATFLKKSKHPYLSDSDSEILGHLIALEPKTLTFEERIAKAVKKIEGGFCFLIIHNECLYAVRDKHGIRPLSIGKNVHGNYMVASETVALEVANYDYIKDVKPGEIIKITKNSKLTSSFYVDVKQTHNNFCAMELIYFLRPDSNIDGQNVHKTRWNIGVQLAKENKIDADIVIGVPDSGICGAMGYSKESGILLESGLVKNRYVGRSFIHPSQEEREKLIKMKLNPNKSVINGKRVIMIDDSIVRGSTMKTIIKIIKEAGAKEIHILITSPKFISPCLYGIDTPTKGELKMANMSIEEYLKELKYANSLNFVSLEGLQKAVGRYSKDNNLCTSCFTGKYLKEESNHE